jgi:hypothetical protein
VIYSKLLCEYTVVANVNDKFKVTQEAGAVSHTITLTAGRYRDHVALCSEIQTQLNAAFGTWTAAVSNTAGTIELDCDEGYALDWNTGTYGTTLRDDLGFDGTETGGGSGEFTVTGSSCHVGGFYPTEPVESDSRPKETGTDTWSSDTYQQMGRTGVLSTKGGSSRVFDRAITFLLPQADLENFSAWLAVCALGRSFAYYHNRTVAWDGASNEYEEYKLQAEGEQGISYRPEMVDPANTIWHRATLLLIKRVAATP